MHHHRRHGARPGQRRRLRRVVPEAGISTPPYPYPSSESHPPFPPLYPTPQSIPLTNALPNLASRHAKHDPNLPPLHALPPHLHPRLHNHPPLLLLDQHFRAANTDPAIPRDPRVRERRRAGGADQAGGGERVEQAGHWGGEGV